MRINFTPTHTEDIQIFDWTLWKSDILKKEFKFSPIWSWHQNNYIENVSKLCTGYAGCVTWNQKNSKSKHFEYEVEDKTKHSLVPGGLEHSLVPIMSNLPTIWTSNFFTDVIFSLSSICLRPSRLSLAMQWEDQFIVGMFLSQ